MLELSQNLPFSLQRGVSAEEDLPQMWQKGPGGQNQNLVRTGQLWGEVHVCVLQSWVRAWLPQTPNQVFLCVCASISH